MQLRRVFLSLAVVVFAVLPGLAQSGTWSVTGSMAHARSGQGTALLANGQAVAVFSAYDASVSTHTEYASSY